MSNRTNLSFFNSYMELDKVCAKSLGIKKGGVSAYIGKLVELRYAPGRSEVLPKLVEYRKIRNIMAHEENAISDIHNITKVDVQWINRLSRSISAKRDPVSRYHKKAKRAFIWKKFRIVIIALMAIVLAVGAYLILSALNII